MNDPDLSSLDAIHLRAEAELDPAVWHYLWSGTGASLTATGNVRAWDRLRLLPRAFGGGAPDTSAQLLGRTLRMPILVAPTGRATRFHPDGEAAVLAAAQASGTVAVLPSSVLPHLQGLCGAVPAAAFWMQLYFSGDRGRLIDEARQACALGAEAIVLTLDLIGRSHTNTLPLLPKAAWENASVEMRPPPTRPSLEDVQALAAAIDRPLLVKGIVRADDARAALDCGAAGVVVSNHGGKQLDTCIATADALPAIVDAIAGEGVVLVDGGLRSGVSVLKALALGAQAVLIGRPATAGLAAAGADGVGAAISLLQAELLHAMTLCGAEDLCRLDRDLIVGLSGPSR